MRRSTPTVLGLFLLAGLIVTSSPLFTAPIPPAAAKTGGVFVLDDSDPVFRGKAAYDDHLSWIDAKGALRLRVGGLNNAESIGSSRHVAVDTARQAIWVIEHAEYRVRKLSFEGKELLRLRDLRANAIAVDPDTGHLWVATSKGTIYGESTVVFSRDGKELDRLDVPGFDIAYDRKGKAFWVAGKHLFKVSSTKRSASGNYVIDSRKDIAAWCSSSVAVNQTTGQVWVTNREYSPNYGKDELLGFDNDCKPNATIPLADPKSVVPFHASVDSKTGKVWVTLFHRSVHRYMADGRLDATFKYEACCAQADEATGGAWVVTKDEVLSVNARGEVQRRVKHRAPTRQAWVCPY